MEAPTTPSLEQELLAKLVSATRLGNTLPAPGDDLEFCATFPGFRQAQAGVRARIQRMLGAVLQRRGVQPPRGAAGDDEWYERVVDVSDEMLEAAEVAYDNARGVSNTTQNTLAAGAAASAAGGAAGAAAGPRGSALAAQQKQLLRPQLSWARPVDNSDAPFVPKLTSKPNALIPLDEAMSRAVAAARAPHDGGGDGAPGAAVRRPSENLGAPGASDASDPSARRAAALRAHASALGLVSGAAADSAPGGLGPNAASAYTFGHPYDAEVAAFAPSAEQLAPSAERLYRPLHETPCDWVDDADSLEEMLAHLATQPEIAIDVEHHSLHSYRGFACLLQLSSRERDFLVDALALRDGLCRLNEVLTDASVVKVLHGADSDVIWLQRDLGLYLVGLFDTGQAARVLGLASASLSFALRHYCGVHADKKLQLADWRLRPLTAEMAAYARADTHYLLYVHDRVKHELAEADARAGSAPDAPGSLTRAVWERSASIARQCYRIEPFDPSGHAQLLRRSSVALTPDGVRVHRALFCWRDALARQLDESPGAVLPAHLLAHLAAQAPSSAQAVAAAWGGAMRAPMPALVSARAAEIAQVVARALDGRAPDGGGGGGAALAGVSLGAGAAADAGGGGAAKRARASAQPAAPAAAAAAAAPAAPRGPAGPAQDSAAAAQAGPFARQGERAWVFSAPAAAPSLLALHLLGSSAAAAPAAPTAGALASTAEPAVQAARAAEVRESFWQSAQWQALSRAASQPTAAAAPPAPTAEEAAARRDGGALAQAPRAHAAEAAHSGGSGSAAAPRGAPRGAGEGEGPEAARGAQPARPKKAAGKDKAGKEPLSALVDRYGHASKQPRASPAKAAGGPAAAHAKGGAGGGAGAAAGAGDGAGVGARAADFMRKIGWMAEEETEDAEGGKAARGERAGGAAAGAAAPKGAGKRTHAQAAGGGDGSGGAAEGEAAGEAGDDAEAFWTSPSQLPAGGRRGGRSGRGGRGRDGGRGGRGRDGGRGRGAGRTPDGGGGANRQKPSGPRGEPRNTPGPVKPHNHHKGRSGSYT